jgi:hypothetical protein
MPFATCKNAFCVGFIALRDLGRYRRKECDKKQLKEIGRKDAGWIHLLGWDYISVKNAALLPARF